MPNGQSAEAGMLTIAPRGELRADFSTTGAPLHLDLVDPATGHIAQFAKNELLRIAALGFPDPAETTAAATVVHKFWLPGALPLAVPCDVWLRVTTVSDEGTHFRYAVQVREKSGPDCRFPAGTAVIGYGQASDERILLTAGEEGETYFDHFRTGQSPWQQRESLVRVGRLDDLAIVEDGQAGLAVGATLQQPDNPYIIAVASGLKLSQADLEIGDGQAITVRIGKNGLLQAGTDVDDAESTGLSYEPQAGVLSLRSALNVDGETSLVGPLSLSEGDAKRLHITPGGDFKLGSNVDDPEQTHLHFDATEGILRLRADLHQLGDFSIGGNFLVIDVDRATASLTQSGEWRLGPDVAQEDGSRIHYDPAAETLTLAAFLRLTGDASTTGSLNFQQNDIPTIALSADGAVAFGEDTRQPETTALRYQPDENAVDISALLRLAGDASTTGSFVFEQNGTPTIALSADGAVAFGPDTRQPETTALRFQPDENAVDISALLRLTGDASTTGSFVFEQNGTPTIALSADGAVAFGPDTRQPETTALRFQPGENAIHISVPLTLGETTGSGTFRLVDGDRTTIRLDAAGEVRIGNNVETDAGTALHYDPASREFKVSGPLILDGAVFAGNTMQFSDGAKPTVRVSSSGDVQFGADITNGQTTGFDFQAAANRLVLRSDLQLYGAAVSENSLQFRNSGRTTAAIAPTGDLRLGTDVSNAAGTGLHFDAAAGRLDLSAKLHLMGDSHVSGDMLLEGDAAIRAGVGDSVRIDKDGIQLRLEPGENNSIKVFGVGRAALINAFQTPGSIQQLDVLAYYNRGVPALHGSLLLGVADAAGGEPDTFLRMTRYFTGVRNIEMDASYVNVRSDRIQFSGNTSIRGNFDFSGTGGADRVFRLRNLPINATGLPSGAVWNDGGTLKVVP